MTPEQTNLWETIERNTAELKSLLTMRQANDAVDDTEFEQDETRLTNLARLIGGYYRALAEEGLPMNLIMGLCHDYQGFTFNQWMGGYDE